jgi:hypothetical protein
MKEKGDLNNGYCFDCIRGCNCAYCDNIIDDEDDIDSVLVCKTCAKVYHSYDPVDEYITGCNFQHGPMLWKMYDMWFDERAIPKQRREIL